VFPTQGDLRNENEKTAHSEHGNARHHGSLHFIPFRARRRLVGPVPGGAPGLDGSGQPAEQRKRGAP